MSVDSDGRFAAAVAAVVTPVLHADSSCSGTVSNEDSDNIRGGGVVGGGGGVAVSHVVTGDFVSHARFLSDADYALCLDNVVKACVDLLLVHPDGRVLLARRKAQPLRGHWWYAAGGRMLPGEGAAAAAARLLKRELGDCADGGIGDGSSFGGVSGGGGGGVAALTAAALAPRLRLLTPFTFAFARRQQAPKHHGTADVALAFALPLTAAEAAAVNLDVAADDDDADKRAWVCPFTVIHGRNNDADDDADVDVKANAAVANVAAAAGSVGDGIGIDETGDSGDDDAYGGHAVMRVVCAHWLRTRAYQRLQTMAVVPSSAAADAALAKATRAYLTAAAALANVAVDATHVDDLPFDDE
jgi:hypothetical protein